MEREYYNLDNNEFEVIDTNLPETDESNIELDDIEHTLKNINLSYLNGNDVLVNNDNEEIISPVLEETKSLFDEPVVEENVSTQEVNAYENSLSEQEIINDILKNKDIIINEINKVNSDVINSALKTGVADSEYLKDIFAKTPVFNNVKDETNNSVNNFALKASQNINQYDEAEKLNAFRI